MSHNSGVIEDTVGPSKSAADDAIAATVEQALIRLVRRATDPRGNATINERAGISLERSESTLLVRIDELEPARISDLAEAIGIDASTASRQVARLVEREYVVREPDERDGRASAHRLTPEGRDVHRRLAAARREWMHEVLADFTPAERAQLADLFDRFVDRLLET